MLHFQVNNERQKLDLEHGDGPVEFGRAPSEDGKRIVVEDRYVSRCQLRVEQVSDGSLRMDNLGQPFPLPDGAILATGDSRILSLPYKLKIGETTIKFRSDRPQRPPQQMPVRDESLQTIAQPIQFDSFRPEKGDSSLGSLLGASPSPEVLARWFETLLTVQRAAAGSDAFFDETARAVVNLVGLDCGLVIMRRGNGWETRAHHMMDSSKEDTFSRSIVTQVLQDRRTLYRSPQSSESASLATVESVVASPVFDQDQDIVGVVYGARRNDSLITRTGISPLEAQLVQLLAAAVSAGLARKEQEAAAARNRARFEQFFSPELADELERNPSLLDGATREITIFFSDIRSFSRISEVLPARDLFRFVGDVMDRLTECILQYKGVIIDYYGDGVAAMWNAPTDLPNHAELACRAAVAMQEEAVRLNETWQDVIGMPLKFGIGINTGTAEVGNAGSSRRLKYGPRGHAVNLAARVEGATKQMGVPVLVTGATRTALGKDFATRRLCSVRVVGIEESVALYELYCGTPQKAWLARRDKYEQALTLYESRDGDHAASLVEELLSADPSGADAASRLLADRITELRNSQGVHDTVYQLQSK